MTRRVGGLLALALTVLAAAVGASIGGGADDDTPAASVTTTTEAAAATTAAPTTTAPPSTTTTTTPPPTLPASPWPALVPGPARAVVTPTGLVLPVVADRGDGTYDVQTPCAVAGVATGTPLSGAHVVLDPGHGGSEPGAVGPNGLREKDVNLAVAQRLATALRAQGAVVVLTRDLDVRMTLSTRGLLGTTLAPLAFVSIHHNADPDGPSGGPGTEVYFQVASEPSRRLAGLMVEEVRAALAPFGVAWTSDAQNGARARIRADDGTDFYGILRRTAGVAAVLSEAAYLSNPPEADLLARPEVQDAEAGAMARAFDRWLRGEEAGAAAFDPNPPSPVPSGGPGGGSGGCVDPPLA
ncbi:MAG: N-acetylmuramoyl-L-alanine amidase [Acidimicrobiia bacterium]|nr:N-acetylmuramoyl-L-alanine amidase [Acidimicrobiia bacterium]